MKKHIIDLLDEAVKNIPGELHREGKNLIGYDLVSVFVLALWAFLLREF